MLEVITNAPYPNRVQITLGAITSPPSGYAGPFVQNGPLGAFNAIRDLQIYVDGSLQTVQSYNFDSANNRYLIYMNQGFNLEGFVQVVHHVPNPPFQDANSVELVGFALIGNFTPSSDVLAPQMVLVADPATVPFGTPSTTLLWATTGVEQVKIVGSNGLNTGFLGPSGIYTMPLGSPGVITLTMTGYDAGGNPIYVGSPPEILMVTATVTITSISGYLVQDDGSRFLLDDGSGFFLLDA